MRHLKSYKQFEDANACASTAGMGSVSSSQPSSFSGSLNGPAFSSGGGSVGSGDVGSSLGIYSKSPAIKKRRKSHKRKDKK